MAIDFGRGEVPFHKVVRLFYHVVLQGHINCFSCCITTITKPMATKLDKTVTYHKKTQPKHVFTWRQMIN